MKYFCLLSILATVAFSCKQKPQEQSVSSVKYSELYRPQYHFTPDHNWTNDPNGLLYYNSEYHIFYQYNPYANVWGHMSWGHAVSKDLLHWEHLPVAIEEYLDKATGDSTMIFSGSAVADVNNTSGFFTQGSGGIVAIYTSHLHRGGQQLAQHQSIAHSSDNGRTFTRHEGNPVLDIQRKDFRDPKVFWYEQGKKWIMAAVIPDEFKVRFFESPNLKDWKMLSDFGPLGDKAKIWECPDLLQVPMADDATKKKWVLIVSNSHPQGSKFVGMQYFVGDFDGKTFTAENPGQYPLYIEYGKDFYAGVTFNAPAGAPGANPILLGWANNWAYANLIPTSPWKGAMALPRELSLAQTPEGSRLIQAPIENIKTLRDTGFSDLATTTSQAVELEYELTPQSGTTEAGLRIFKSDSTETIIGYDAAAGEVFFDRTNSGKVYFQHDFSSIERARVRLINGKLKLHIFIDHSVVEVYINDGEQVITDQVFPTTNKNVMETYFKGESPAVSVNGWTMKSVWH